MKHLVITYFLSCLVLCSAVADAQINIGLGATTDAQLDSLRTFAKDFTTELKRGGDFQFAIADRIGGLHTNDIRLVVRQQADAANIGYPAALQKFNPEGYYIKSDIRQVTIVGNTALAIQQATYDYLERLGFHYYMPGSAWQIIPSLESVFTRYQQLTQPAYEYRSMANGNGFYRNKQLESDFNGWYKANRLGGSFQISVGHSYQAIVSNNLETFKQHPEYFAGNVAKGTTPPGPKFNVSNKDLVSLVIADAKKRITVPNRPGRIMNMVSMEPSDAGGFCTSPDCQQIGTVSDQVFYLANAVAKAIRKDYPGAWVGTLAYNEHIAPTKYDLEPNLFVMVTNGFNRTQFSTNELLAKWSKKAKRVGVYEYLSVYAWDNDLPGKSNASHLDYLKRSIRDYHENGATAYLAETTVGWMSKGLGQYVASKLLWDYRLDVDSLADEFYKNCFGNAAPVIKKLFKSWEATPGGLISDNSLADWLNWVNEADKLTDQESVRQRLDYIRIYLHYLVLYRKLKTDPTNDNMDRVLNFAYRTFDVSAFATVPAMVALPFYSGFKNYGLNDRPNHTWMGDPKQLTASELRTLFRSDLSSVKKVEGLRSVDFSKKFRRSAAKPTVNMKPGNLSPSFTGQTSFLIRIDQRSAENYLEIKSGYSARPADDKKVSIKVYNNLQYLSIKEEADVKFSAEQDKKMTNEKISLASLEPCEYILKVDDQFKIFSIRFSASIYCSVIMDAEKMLQTSSVTGLNTFYFSVTPETSRFVIHKSKVLKLLSPAGRELNFSNNKQESVVIDVAAGEVGLWQIFAQAGSLYIEGIAPYLGITPDKYLFPADK